MPPITSASRSLPLSFRQRFWTCWASLKTMANPAASGELGLWSCRSQPDRNEGALDRSSGTHVPPVVSGEVQRPLEGRAILVHDGCPRAPCKTFGGCRWSLRANCSATLAEAIGSRRNKSQCSLEKANRPVPWRTRDELSAKVGKRHDLVPKAASRSPSRTRLTFLLSNQPHIGRQKNQKLSHPRSATIYLPQAA